MQTKPVKVLQIPQWPDVMTPLTRHMDMSDRAGAILGWGGYIDTPHYDVVDMLRPKLPFLVIRGEDDRPGFIHLRDADGAKLLSNNGIAADLLVCLTDQDFCRLLAEFHDLCWTENEDVDDDDEAYGFSRYDDNDVLFLTDGRAIAAWNGQRDFSAALEWSFSDAEGDDEDEDDQEDLDHYLQIAVPKITSAHEAAASLKALTGLVDTMNNLILKKDRTVEFGIDQDSLLKR
jgi:hypothetical protein